MGHIKNKKGLLGLMAIGLGLLLSTPIYGTDNFLVGEYGVTGTNGCINSPEGFDANFFPISTDPPLVTGSVYGVMKFNRDRTGIGEAKEVAVRLQFPAGGEFVEFTIPFHYTFNRSDGTITLIGDIGWGIWKKGTWPDLPWAMLNWSMTGTVSLDQKTILLSSKEVEVEVFTASPTSLVPTFYQICHRSWILNRIN
jgi:hypothetical protein